jgi:succinate dehydrogenase / fumarate reductase, membrane anchor subunit
MVLLVASIFYHMRLGLQVVIEDYEQDQNRVALLVVMNLFVFTIAAVAIFSILKIAFGAAA